MDDINWYGNARAANVLASALEAIGFGLRSRSTSPEKKEACEKIIAAARAAQISATALEQL